jgi:hypothetical protein
MHEVRCVIANRPHVACMNHGVATPEHAIGASEAEFPHWFGEELNAALSGNRRCVVHVDANVWLSDGWCAFLVRSDGLKTQVIKDLADVLRSAIQTATVNVQEGHVMFEPDTKTSELGYGARNFVVGFGGRMLRGLHVALARRLYGDLRWAMNPNNELTPLVAWADGQPVAIIMPIFSARKG